MGGYILDGIIPFSKVVDHCANALTVECNNVKAIDRIDEMLDSELQEGEDAPALKLKEKLKALRDRHMSGIPNSLERYVVKPTVLANMYGEDVLFEYDAESDTWTIDLETIEGDRRSTKSCETASWSS